MQGDLFRRSDVLQPVGAASPGAAGRIDDDERPPLLGIQAKALRQAEAALALASGALVIHGAARSGKSLLARHVVAKSGGCLIDTREADARRKLGWKLADGETVLLDAAEHVGQASAPDPHDIWAALSSVSARQGRLVLIGRGSPITWAGGLADLSSRLRAAPAVEFAEPDPETFSEVLDCFLRQRFLRLDLDLLEHVAALIERRWTVAERFSDTLADRLAAQPGVRFERLVRRLAEDFSVEEGGPCALSGLPLQPNLL